MANRIVIRVLGNTMAPYSSQVLLAGSGPSEDWHLNQEQVQRFTDIPANATYPLAKSVGTIKYVNKNHFDSISVYSSLTSAQIDALANA